MLSLVSHGLNNLVQLGGDQRVICLLRLESGQDDNSLVLSVVHDEPARRLGKPWDGDPEDEDEDELEGQGESPGNGSANVALQSGGN